jgi:hypothetical protein
MTNNNDYDEKLNATIKAIINDPDRESRLSEPLTDPPLVLIGYRTGTTGPQSALLKLEVLIQSTPPKSVILPIAMSRSQCTELGEALKRLATLPYRPDQKAN